MASTIKILFLLRLNLLIMFAIKSPATAVKIMARVVGSNNKVAITSIANERSITSITGGSPSRYMANIKAL